MKPADVFKTAKKILIVGGYGTKNYGDEAILAGILETIRNANPKADIAVIAGDPHEITRIHNVLGRKITNLFSKILAYDTILIGGGTIFRQGMRLRAQMVPLAAYMLRMFGKRTMFYSLGVDRKTSPFARYFLVHAMNKANAVSVRDKDSYEILKEWGVKKNIDIIPDPGIGLQPTTISDKQFQEYGINPQRRKIGLSLRNLKKENDLVFLPEMIKMLKNLIKDGNQVIYFPFCKSKSSSFENDSNIGHAIRKEIQDPNLIILEKDITPQEMKGLVASMDVMIAMRLHAMIFAVSTDTPLIGISYSQKTTSFLKEQKQDVLDAKALKIQDVKRLLAEKGQKKNR